MTAKVIFCRSDGKPVDFDLTGDELTVGRHAHNAIVIDSSHISSTHATFRKHAASGSYELIDLQSSNGTEVNGKLISSVVLRNGDTIMFGPLVARFEREEPNGRASTAYPDDIVGQRCQAAASRAKEILNRTNGTAVGKAQQEAALNSTSADLASAEKKYKSLQLAVKKLDEQRSELEDRTGAADERLRITVAEISDQEAQLDQLREESRLLLAASKARDGIEAEAKVVESRSMDLVALELKFEQLAERKEEEERALAAKAREHRKLEGRNAKLRQECENLERKRREAEQSVAHADEVDTAAASRARTRKVEVEKECAELSERVASLAKRENEFNDLEKQISDRRRELERLATDKQQLETSIQTLEQTSHKLEGIRGELTIAEAERETLSRQVEQGKAELASLDEHLSNAKDELVTQREHLESEAGGKRSEYEKYAAELAAAQTALEKTTANLEEKQLESGELATHANKLQEMIGQRVEEEKELLERQTAAEAALQSTEAAVNLKLRRLAELNQTITLLETVIAEKHTQVHRVDQTESSRPAKADRDAEKDEPKASLEEELTRLGFNITHPRQPS